ncbi:uncharacterized protein LOC129797427 [Lutzomyia longipalpis]|uniref:uncharacterized protein LOC129797427 n=1 Tax=Lutzomyia longipalpis TaxID=7200 RepID=UPI0024841313|nr:uncharacterized protein LOC129797427 [Lutzomyia longipalpis]XP_055695944.1 uncharacterized protein LOC129797427 [Lutzomyia longipalpis]
MDENFTEMDVMKVSEEELRQMRRDREKMSEEFQHFLEMNLKKSSHDDNKSQIECELAQQQQQQKVLNSLNVTQAARNLNESPRSPLHLSPRDGMKTPRGISSSAMSIRDAMARESPSKAVKSVVGGGDDEKKIPPHGRRTAPADEMTVCKKVKSYDPIETRRYMRDQQRKRQEELKKTITDDRARKQEIQKRLSELQESTRRILGRNVKQKVGKDVRKVGAPNHRVKATKPPMDMPKKAAVAKDATIIISSPGSQKLVDQAAIKGSNATKSPRINTTERYDQQGNFHRNVRITGTPKIPQSVNINDLGDRNLLLEKDKSICEKNPQTPESGMKTDETASVKRAIAVGEDSARTKSIEEKLEVPSHLKLSPSKGEKKKKHPRGNLPHWLRPTTINTYPYDFITSVREKLDAISNAKLPEKSSFTITNIHKDLPTSLSSGSGRDAKTDEWTDINRWTRQQEYNANRGRTSNTQSLEDPPLFPGSYIKKSHQKSDVKKKSDQKSTSDPLTNFSSMSIHVPDSNTISDISSIQSEIFPSSIRLSSTKITNQNERAASVSDGAKTANASLVEETHISGESVKGVADECIAPVPRDNNQLSPLSTELADTMRIMSPRRRERGELVIMKATNDDGNNNEGGGKIGGFSNLSSDKFQPLDTSANKAEIHGGNLTDLLEAFNRSLSQVIQMNQQLYSALSKSPNVPKMIKNPQENALECVKEIPEDATKQQQQPPVDVEGIFEEVKSTVKNADGQKLDDATALRESVSEIDGSEGVDKSGEIDLGPIAVNCRDNMNAGASNGLAARAAKDLARDGDLMDAKEANSTIGSDIFAVFNQTDMEVSYVSSGGDEARETSITYSNIGLFEQMIKTEKLKGDHLMTMIRMREKALIDRTRGQIAWLELQKKRFREKGKVLEITAIRKKQRAILLKLERERGQLQKQLQLQSQPTSRKSPSHRVRVVEKTFSNIVTLRRSPIPSENRGALKGYEMEAGTTLERLLEQREQELQKRRKHVEFLIQWHQRLEKEEKDVKEIEKKLLNCNLERFAEKNIPALMEIPDVPGKDDGTLRRVEEIDRSLQLLSSIVEKSEEEVVEVRGMKLNLLWKKLIGREENKFLPEKVYRMTREDFSQLYEEAKIAVLREFHNERHIRHLLEESMTSATKESASHNSTEEKTLIDDFREYTTDDFETVTSVRETANELGNDAHPKGSGQENVEDSFEEEEASKSNGEESQIENFSKNSEFKGNSEAPEEVLAALSASQEAAEDTFQGDSLRIQEVTEETPKTEIPSALFSPEIISQADEEQLISEMTLPSFSETTIVEEPTLEEIEGTEEEEEEEEEAQIAERSEIVEKSHENTSQQQHSEGEREKFSDSALSVHSTAENLDKTPNISQESLNTLQDVESVPIESLQDDEEVDEEEEKDIPTELEKRIIQVDVSLKDLSSTMEKSPILEVLSPRNGSSTSAGSSTSSPEASLESSEGTTNQEEKTEENVSNEEESIPQESSSRYSGQESYSEGFQKSPDDSQGAGNYSQQKIRDYKIPNRMPDIISEAELLRRQQMQIEQEIKQLEQTVPAVFLREIPNKPPPPYVPPAQDSPLATIFPSEERVVDLVMNRTKELFFSTNPEADKSDGYGITNVYEKIIIGMCEEIFGEIKETLDTHYDAPFQRVRLYKNKLCFYNPPDRLKCIQEHILEAIRQILQGGGNYSRIQASCRRKRDQIDEIVIEEMLEDDWKWSNFQIEETEVLDMMTETIFSTLLEDAIRDVDVAFTKKFPHN